MSNLSTGMIKSIKDLTDYRFKICSYQRGYRWDENQVTDLIRDLYEFSTCNDQSVEYSLQPIIVKERDDGSWELVDGQQRLTTLWLITKVRDVARREPGAFYSLEYEGKEAFSNLLNQIDEESKTNPSINDIISGLDDMANQSLDACMLIEALNCISKYEIDGKGMYTFTHNICDNFSKVKVIWYQLEKDEDPINIFSAVNNNLVKLTNAELIKAVLWRSIGSKTDDAELKRDFANEWESIEKRLNNEELWLFITGNKYEKSTHIELLFDIWYYSIIRSDPDDDRAVFRAVNKALDEGLCPIDLWEDIKKISESIEDWYNDYYLYHIIGLLVTLKNTNANANLEIDFLKMLYDKYSTMSKSIFKEYVLNCIKTEFIGERSQCIAGECSLEAIQNGLSELAHGDPNVKRVLLLYNIAILINADNKYERFPFDLYNSGIKWDIEHINPKTPDDSDISGRKEWLESYRKIIEDNELVQEIDACINNNLQNFDYTAEKIHELFKLSNLDYIGNLVILDASTNRSYKNKCFDEKRKTIIEIERTAEIKDESLKFILTGTKWVFLKGFDTNESEKVWGASDTEKYIEDIAVSLNKMLGGNVDE